MQTLHQQEILWIESDVGVLENIDVLRERSGMLCSIPQSAPQQYLHGDKRIHGQSLHVPLEETTAETDFPRLLGTLHIVLG
jgi:hypothetical protein